MKTIKDNKRERFLKILLDDPEKHAPDFVEIFLESDEAKNLLRKAGFGCTGMNIVKTAQGAIDEIESLRS